MNFRKRAIWALMLLGKRCRRTTLRTFCNSWRQLRTTFLCSQQNSTRIWRAELRLPEIPPYLWPLSQTWTNNTMASRLPRRCSRPAAPTKPPATRTADDRRTRAWSRPARQTTLGQSDGWGVWRYLNGWAATVSWRYASSRAGPVENVGQACLPWW